MIYLLTVIGLGPRWQVCSAHLHTNNT